MISRQPETSIPVDVVGALRLESSDGVDLTLTGEGAHLTVRIASVRDLVRLRRTSRAHIGGRRSIEALQGLIARGGVEIRMLLKGCEVVRLAAASRPTWIARTLRVAPAEVRVRGLLRALIT